MKRSVCAIAAFLSAAGAAVADDAKKLDEAKRPEGVSPGAASATGTPVAEPKRDIPTIVVHQNAVPVDARDARVRVGDVRISMASWATPDGSPASAGEPAPIRSDGAITVPSNTLGPGEPLWRTRDREDAQRKQGAAEADLARARAERAENIAQRDQPYTFFGNSFLNSGRRSRHEGLRGPVTTTITYDDSLGSTAQRAYFDAAYPRLNGTTDARDEAVRRFGRDATPPIVRIQNDVDRAHTNANREHPAR